MIPSRIKDGSQPIDERICVVFVGDRKVGYGSHEDKLIGSGANSEFPIGYSVIWGAGYWDE
jgi:hypothetical protein